MIVAEQQFARSEIALRQTGYMALIQSLGYADAIRFLMQLSRGEGDSLEWQDRLFGDASVDELYEQAQEHWQRSRKSISRTLHQRPSPTPRGRSPVPAPRFMLSTLAAQAAGVGQRLLATRDLCSRVSCLSFGAVA